MVLRSPPRYDPNVLRELERLNLMLDASVDCIKLIDIDGNLLKMNRSGCEALGVPVGTTQFGMKWLELLPPDIRRRGRRALKVAGQGKRASFAGRSELPGEKPVHWDNILTPVRDGDGDVAAILCLSRDVTRQREAERKLRLASDYDALTGIANRRQFRRYSEQQLRKAGNACGTIGLVIIDIDKFKEVNDRLGHDAGDAVLKDFAARLCDACREGEFPARLGGDEFAVVVTAERGRPDLSETFRRVQAALSRPFVQGGTRLAIRISAGGAISSPHLNEIGCLMKASDTALYAAKSAGRDGFRMFEG